MIPAPSGTPTPEPRSTGVLLGADVGGSHTLVGVARADLALLARAEGPGAVMRPGGGARSAVIIAATARRAAAGAGVSLPADAMVVGAAGAGRDAEQVELARALERADIARRVHIVMDMEIALRAAFGVAPGILLNAGTGAVACARDPAGVRHRAGGHGWQLGDEGGGYWVGHRALVLVGRAQDGRGDAGTLPQRLLAALGLAAFDDLVAWSTIATPAQVAQLAADVVAAARDGDPIAAAILAEAARALADLVQALERWFPGGGPVPVVTAGGLLTAPTPLLPLLAQALTGVMARARLEDRRIDPVAGAVEMAAELL